MKKLSALLPLVAVIALTACQTVEGAGKDLQSAGSAISTESRKVAN